ncbi:hypothetical protein OIO90_001848 [Microbotryomycetes sp. JL221]|nr:hypothetical protein OIO90_001848 [Microbotryomycetes sp. JL221]
MATRDDMASLTPARNDSSNATRSTSSLLNKALDKVVKTVNGDSDSSTPSKRSQQEMTPTSVRAQFEQQQDFIGFEPSPSPPPSHSHGSARRGPTSGARATPRGDNRRRDRSPPNGSASKRRRLDEQGHDSMSTNDGTDRMQRRERDRSTPWCDEPGVDWDSCQSATDMLNKEAQAFVSYISPTPPEHDLRMWTIELIRRTIKKQFNDADVQCFGSVGTGLYLPGGDIDLVILCPSFPSPPLKPSQSLLRRIAALLLSSRIAEPNSIVVIAKARVPIVKFNTRHGGFAVDISVNQANGIEAAVRVRKMLEDFAFRPKDYVEPGSTRQLIDHDEEDEEEQDVVTTTRPEAISQADLGVARSLVMLIKMFLNQRGMNEVFTGGLGSYSIILLVISFLQLHPKIQTGQINPHLNVGLLFVEFLEYYGKHFNYDEAGITLKGRGGYFNKHDKGWYRPNQPYLLSIEDPNDPSNDVSGGSHNIIRVRQTFAGAFESLTATLFERVSHFQHRSNQEKFPTTLSNQVLPNADDNSFKNPLKSSVLGSIIGMTKSSLQERRLNIELFNSGVLQNMLQQPGGENVKIANSKLRKMMETSKERKLKEEKKEKKKAKTLAKLEKRKKKKERKLAERQEARSKDSSRQSSVSRTRSGGEDDEEDDDDDDSDDDQVQISTIGSTSEQQQEQGFVIDVTGDRTEQSTLSKRFAPGQSTDGPQNDDGESRYSIGSPVKTNGRSQSTRGGNTKLNLQETIFVGGSSEDEDDSDDEQHDQDVQVGGASGDVLLGDSTTKTIESTTKDHKHEHDKKKKAKARFWANKGMIDRDAKEYDD